MASGGGFKLAELFADITVNDVRFQNQLKSVHSSLNKVQMNMDRIAATATRMFLVGSGAIGGLLVLQSRQERAETKLRSAIAASGGAAGQTAEQMIAYAQSLQQATVFGDEAIIGAQALLATFVHIKGLNFDRAVETVLDLSTIMGGDLLSNAKQLGMALNDPAVGMTRLTRAGVSFSEQEKKLIKDMVALNKIGEAQVFMLDAIANQGLGGAARAVARDFGGQMQQLGNILGDLGETLGKTLVPAISATATKMKEISISVTGWIKSHAQLAVSLGTIAAGIVTLTGIVAGGAGLLAVLAALSAALLFLATNPVVLVVAGLGAAAVALIALGGYFAWASLQGETFGDKLQNVFKKLAVVFGNAETMFRTFKLGAELAFLGVQLAAERMKESVNDNLGSIKEAGKFASDLIKKGPTVAIGRAIVRNKMGKNGDAFADPSKAEHLVAEMGRVSVALLKNQLSTGPNIAKWEEFFTGTSNKAADTLKSLFDVSGDAGAPEIETPNKKASFVGVTELWRKAQLAAVDSATPEEKQLKTLVSGQRKQTSVLQKIEANLGLGVAII